MENIQFQFDSFWFWWKEQLQGFIPRRKNTDSISSLKINMLNEETSALVQPDLDQSSQADGVPVKLDELLARSRSKAGHPSTWFKLHLSNQLCLTKSQKLPAATHPRSLSD